MTEQQHELLNRYEESLRQALVKHLTEKGLLEGQLLEVEELNETLNYAKTELAATEKLQRELIANISHDLRTPMTTISVWKIWSPWVVWPLATR